ncbi:DNA-binding protein [Serratia sp. JSRIV004]|uniref:DNA-binding protein n=1 Tax=Serratia sp. JSRIV004 TaxID=2831895 RepID=UPI001CC00A64|nr:DNA-binding protein [Serratia sp. JSRIV004]UAN55376.1 DNA-binding protein [Serratia sp. JSRIV004]
MRDYATVSPQFWLGKTGRELRKAGAEAQVVAFYLMSSPHANMLGLYYLPVLYMAHETGLGLEGALKGLKRAIEAGFCSYDEATEMVWVHEMAAYQVGKELKPGDNKCAGVRNGYASLPENPFLSLFYERYKKDFHLNLKREMDRGFEGASEGLASQDQDQDQEQDQNTSSHGEKNAKRPHDNFPPSEQGSAKVEGKKTRHEYTPEFEAAWMDYPRRPGSPDKHSAFKSWNARLRDGVTPEAMQEGVRRYAAFVEATGKSGTEFIKQAKTFFGPSKHFEDEWAITSGENHAEFRPNQNDQRSYYEQFTEWEQRQPGAASLGAMGADVQGVRPTLECEEWQSTLGTLGGSDQFDDE